MDALKILVVFAFLIAPCIIFGNWWWTFVWASIAILIALWEVYGRFISKDKKTISKQFWLWKDKHPKAKWIALLGYVIFFGYLAMHLWFRW